MPPPEILGFLAAAAATAALVGIAILLFRRPPAPDSSAQTAQTAALANNLARVEQNLRELRAELTASVSTAHAALRAELDTKLATAFGNQLQRIDELRKSTADAHAALRAEQAESLAKTRAELTAAATATRATLDTRLDALATQNTDAHAALRATLTQTADATRDATRAQFADHQQKITAALADARAAQNQQLADITRAQNQRLADFAATLATLQTTLADALTATRAELATALARTREEQARAAATTRETLDKRLENLAAQNAEKLDQMRQTVDEKLQTTLEKRLSENFKLVGENLEKVVRSLGEMQQMAASVGDLKRVLTNVKTRGTWGEYQLAALLENLLSPDQYAANVKPAPRRDTIVEFAIKLPGQADDNKPIWLPIDSKFPKEDYERLVAAAERADPVATEQAATSLAANVETFARDIRDKYIVPPHTTDFAILFLPTEGLYAEVLRRPGLADKIQRECRVLIASPTTLAALLNSLQMGFRTLAIQKRSGEVWKLLSAIKTNFHSFGSLLEKVQRRLDDAGKAVGDAANRHRILTKSMSKVEALPAADAAQLLPDLPAAAEDSADAPFADAP